MVYGILLQSLDWFLQNARDFAVRLQAIRRLVAILICDVVGYTRLMEQDESGTWERIKSLRRELIDPAIGRWNGRLVKTTGDGFLSEFPSVSDAISCGRSIQHRLRELGDPPERALVMRIGIDVGDVIIDEDDVFGETVNIASRLQTLSPPGGLCISHRAYQQLGNRTSIAVEDIGECQVRNLSRTVPALVWRPELDRTTPSGAVAGWQSAVTTKEMDAAAPRASVAAAPAPILAAAATLEPSIAILPFANISGDPEQAFFADGIAEDITTQLAKFNSLFVTSRASAFAYRENNRDAHQIGRELGVDYVVEGSVRKIRDQVRITVQMVDVTNGRHVWAEKYDRTMEDLFAVQDEITETIVGTLAGRVEADRVSKAHRQPTNNLRAYELVLKGLALHKSGVESYEQMADAAKLFRQATELDPNYARAHAWRACSAARMWPRNASPDELLRLIQEAMGHCRRALELDPDEAEAHRVMGALYLLLKNFQQAEHHIERALAINPNHSLIAIKAATFFSYAGRPERAEPLIRRAMRLKPFHPDWYWLELGLCLFVAARYDEAVSAFEKAQDAAEEHRQTYLSACQALLERKEDAAASRGRALALNPGFSAEQFVGTQRFRNSADAARLRDGLRAAGLPL